MEVIKIKLQKIYIFFTWKLIVIDKKIFYKFEICSILIDLNQIFPMNLSEIEISLLVESYDKKNDENWWNGYIAEMRIFSKLYKYINLPNYTNISIFQTIQIYQFQILMAQIEDLNQDCVNILRTYLQCFPRNVTSKSITVGPVHCVKRFS